MGITKALSQLLSLLSVFSPCDLAIRGISDCSKANDLCHSLSVSFSLESAVLLPLCREKNLCGGGISHLMAAFVEYQRERTGCSRHNRQLLLGLRGLKSFAALLIISIQERDL